MLTAIAMVPLMGGLAVAIDYSEMTRERSQALNALDAAALATARAYQAGTPEEQLPAFAEEFFRINSNGLDMSKVDLTLALPNADTGGGTVKLTADLKYSPHFLPVLTSLLGKNAVTEIDLGAFSEVQLKNTLEVALVLDNSGSMSDKGGSSNQLRIDLLKAAAKELVSTLAKQGEQMKQVSQPVQFSVVPFASSVNVGSGYEEATWMDRDGISPIHHENFDWSTMSKAKNVNKYVENVGGVWYRRGKDWGTQENGKITRFTMYKEMQHYSCTATNWNGSCRTWSTTAVKFANWKGCVEARPSPYNVDDTPPSSATPATLFVPMFAPDESSVDANPENSWWPDGSITGTTNHVARQSFMPKYFPGTPPQIASSETTDGPNKSCSTTAITPLTDVSVAAGKAVIDAAIDGMQPNGATNVPEGMAWGWRTVSSGAPFTEGRPESEKGNDKVVIVVTDGANTYYTPGSLGDWEGRYSDGAGNKSVYSALGYVKLVTPGYTTNLGRMFQGTSSSISNTNYDNANYTAAMNEHFKKLCDNAKAKKIMVMTVALDLSNSKPAEKTQIEMLKKCASDSRFRKDPDDPSKPAKLFWNSTGKTLSDDFKKIGDELSNLRIVG
ncbi:pilus assembly protein TadG-related protein [Kumtagia ephedrae]|nr:vWA domain-containing protein [Mesorhizobium ephedrae]